MRDRLHQYFRPHIEPEQRFFHTRCASILCSVLYLFLGLWLLYFIASPLLEARQGSNRQLEIVPIVLLAILTTWVRSTIRNKEIFRVAAWISMTFLLLGVSAALFHPSWIYLLVPIFLASTASMGTLIGGGMVVITGAGNLLLVLLLWLYERSMPGAGYILDPVHETIFIIMSAFALVGTALLLQNNSANLKTTLRLLNDRTQQLVSIAHTDPLTSLANRRFLIEILEREYSRARRQSRPLSLIYLDLDSFKPINDRFGHLFGDEILRGTAVSLKAVLRSTDMLARIGGDEFAVLLPDTDLEGSEIVASKLRRALSSYSAQLDENVPPLTFCSGISVLHPEDTSIDDLLSRADDAQYLAKRTGKGHTRLETEIPKTGRVPF